MYAHVRLILERDFRKEIKHIYNYYPSVLTLLDIIIIIIIARAAIVSETRDR